MVILLGASGYIGQAFAAELQRRGCPHTTLARSQVDYTRFDTLLEYLRQKRPSLVINAAGYTGKPNVDACENARGDTLQGNTILPITIGHACSAASVPWGHVSSGCIYSGAKIVHGGQMRTEKDLTRPDLRKIVDQDPAAVHGFTENDPPNFTFDSPPSSFYSGTKALAEEALDGFPQTYIWRLRIPFDHVDNPRNYLTKVQSYPKVYDNVNSLSHRGDFVRACVDLWERRAPFGIYNVTNPGFVTTRQVIGLVQKILHPPRA
ncbi:MAG TPA: sugar nucleotide-binding protein, partial [Verrucomicrobiae bacterium]|nr:sugar nucleotide-binding protein [Verrucomicrobiae bacterium]